MGRDKALLPWGSATLLEHAVTRLRAVCPEVRILSGAPTRYAELGLTVLADARPDAGPLAGVLAGLDSLATSEHVGLFLALDVPRVPAALLAHLLDAAAGWDGVVPVTAAGPEPLCAVYRASCREAIGRRLDRGERRMDAFWPDVRLRRLDERALRAFGDPLELFANLNAPEDYRHAAGTAPAAEQAPRATPVKEP